VPWNDFILGLLGATGAMGAPGVVVE